MAKNGKGVIFRKMITALKYITPIECFFRNFESSIEIFDKKIAFITGIQLSLFTVKT